MLNPSSNAGTLTLLVVYFIYLSVKTNLVYRLISVSDSVHNLAVRQDFGWMVNVFIYVVDFKNVYKLDFIK